MKSLCLVLAMALFVAIAPSVTAQPAVAAVDASANHCWDTTLSVGAGETQTAGGVTVTNTSPPGSSVIGLRHCNGCDTHSEHTEVSFPNGDPFFHNVFSLSSAAAFNLGRYPRGQSKPARFAKAGLVKVFCDIHSHMSASILVLDHPYFTIPGTDGNYDIRSVPAGQYTIVGWHERVGERSASVRVEAGRTATIDLTVPVEDVP